MTHPVHDLHQPALLDRLREICLALPEATEKLSHGSPSWFCRKMFATWVDDHHGDGEVGFWCAAPPGAQQEMVGSEPGRFFRPPYVGGRGWLGVRLVTDHGADPDWDEVAEIVEDAYRAVAPVTLLRRLDA